MACWMDVKVWRWVEECGVVVGECKASPCDAVEAVQKIVPRRDKPDYGVHGHLP